MSVKDLKASQELSQNNDSKSNDDVLFFIGGGLGYIFLEE